MVGKTAGISCLLPAPHWCSGGMVGGKKQLVYSCLSWPHWCSGGKVSKHGCYS